MYLLICMTGNLNESALPLYKVFDTNKQIPNIHQWTDDLSYRWINYIMFQLNNPLIIKLYVYVYI